MLICTKHISKNIAETLEVTKMTLTPREYETLKSAMSDKLRKLHSETRAELERIEYSFYFKNKPLEGSRDNLGRYKNFGQ